MARSHDDVAASPLRGKLSAAGALGAAPAWGDEEPQDFEPISVRPYFPNRALYRTRGRPRRTLRAPRTVVRRVAPRAGRRNVRSGPRRARAPSRSDEDSESELAQLPARVRKVVGPFSPLDEIPFPYGGGR
jgi:hypothetical protein